jgi:hypothetical protein
MLINIPAFMFLNEADAYSGLYFKKMLKTHYSHWIYNKKENFLKFNYTAVDYKAWFFWTRTLIYTYATYSSMQYLVNRYYKCENFDDWYNKKFILNERAMPIHWTIVDVIIRLLAVLILLYTALPMLSIKPLMFFSKRQEKAI